MWNFCRIYSVENSLLSALGPELDFFSLWKLCSRAGPLWGTEFSRPISNFFILHFSLSISSFINYIQHYQLIYQLITPSAGCRHAADTLQAERVPLYMCLKSSKIFNESGPLGRFSHRVAMSVCVFVCLCAPLGAFFVRPLIGPEVTWSVPGLSLVLT